MQALWGDVLASEVIKPGRISVRTLGLLRDLDSNTARVFLRLCSATIYLKGSDGTIFDARVPSLGGNAAHNALALYGLNFGAVIG